jgi:polyphosphate kinase
METTIDRDLSQIEFHRRVFDEARDETNPLLERVKFLSILGTIVDEFAVGRHAALLDTSETAALSEMLGLLADARSYLGNELVPRLTATGIHLLQWPDLQPAEVLELRTYFQESVLPLLMPLGFDAARPFPHISGKDISLAVLIQNDGHEHFACVEVPSNLPALVPFQRNGEPAYVWLHELISQNLELVFPGTTIAAVHPFKILRDKDLHITPLNGVALRDAIEAGLRQREFGDVRTLTVTNAMPRTLVDTLATHLDVPRAGIHVCSQLVDLSKLGQISDLDRPELRNRPITPRVRPVGLLGEIRRGDVLLHHPFDSFQTVIDFVEEAAHDPDVLAISTTLYRAGRNSPIVEALLAANRAGKKVRVIIELRARFDEAHNLAWGYALEQAGAHVIYGTVNFKVHAKATLVVRREAGRLRRYVHISSGNYNPATSAAYTDIGLFTCREDICHDATQIFNLISGYGAPAGFKSLLVAPFTLRQRVKELIEREISWAARGEAAHMILKMNALGDPEMIDALYRASQQGVRIELIVRGVCCLRPGIPGLSDNIRVRSIVGRFLEHSRAWYFRNGGHNEIYLGSADLLSRNLNDRVEIMVPIADATLKERVHREILGVYLADNVKARELTPEGRYVRVPRLATETAINSQEYFS